MTIEELEAMGRATFNSMPTNGTESHNPQLGRLRSSQATRFAQVLRHFTTFLEELLKS
jgi:hypothetical protein